MHAESVHLKKDQERKKEMRKYKVGLSLGNSMINLGCQQNFVRKTDYEKLWRLTGYTFLLVAVSCF